MGIDHAQNAALLNKSSEAKRRNLSALPCRNTKRANRTRASATFPGSREPRSGQHDYLRK
jgi:hypothetical protein